jgi:hypothetical protein
MVMTQDKVLKKGEKDGEGRLPKVTIESRRVNLRGLGREHKRER